MTDILSRSMGKVDDAHELCVPVVGYGGTTLYRIRTDKDGPWGWFVVSLAETVAISDSEAAERIRAHAIPERVGRLLDSFELR